MAWQTGERIGAYEVLSRLGSGGMATVYKAYHARLQREVAMKVMHPNYQADADFLNRFEREAQIVARLEHPNIVPIYDFAEQDGQPYLVMKYITGQTLRDVLATGAPTLQEIVKICRAVANALDYAHKQGVLHRDIKPSNVMLDEQGTPYLTDFGLARIVQSGESSMSAGMIVGTPNYLAPEQASAAHPISVQSDVYSLGVMLYEMVVGRVPFSGTSAYATIHMHVNEPVPLPSELNPEIPTQVEMVLLRALEKDPAKRYPTPGALADAFEAAIDQSGLRALSPERSRVLRAGELPMPMQGTPTPKRKIPAPTDSAAAAVLLLDEEDSWARLPQEEIIRKRQERRMGMRIGMLAHSLAYVFVNMGIIGTNILNDNDLGSLIPALAWGAGWGAHLMSVLAQEKYFVERLYRHFFAKLEDEYGHDWRATLRPLEVEAEWMRYRKVYDERWGFYSHAVAYLFINVMMWVIYASGGGDFPWPLIVNLAWGVGLFGHWVGVERAANPKYNQSLAAELALMQGDTSTRLPQTAPKRKNSAPTADEGVRLRDDGEFTDSIAASLDDEARRNQR